MSHKVINRFKDTDGHVYEVGDPYPKGKATKKRIEQLSTVHPKYKKVYIEAVEEPVKQEEPEAPKKAAKKK